MKRKTKIILLILFLLTFTGCPIMMPFMMGNMFKKNVDEDIKPEMGAVVYELIEESVTSLAVNKGPYEHIFLRESEIPEDFIPANKFQESLMDVMHSKNGWNIHEGGDVFTSDSERTDMSESDPDRSMAALDTQLYKGSDKLWLAMQLVDARSNRLFWSGLYSRPLPMPG